MNAPRFITFTGFDDRTSIEDMDAPSSQFPIEWGVLFSPLRQGQGRYPSLSKIQELLDSRSENGFRLSAHLCGGHSRDLLAAGALMSWLDEMLPRFDRVQINTTQEAYLPTIGQWAREYELEAILQSRDSAVIPSGEGQVRWLFDASGGTGKEPAGWPVPANRNEFVGYAGGLNPKNVRQHVQTISEIAGGYWIDMESGVRRLDRFSVSLCREVCQAVYWENRR